MNDPAPSRQSARHPAQRPAQRIDKWLWYARIFRSRSLAAKFVETGKIRVKSGDQRTKLQKPAQTVKVGDILTFPYGNQIRVLEVKAPGKRRGPAVEAQTLYNDLSPQMPAKEEVEATGSAPSRPKGDGRPTKKDRRALDKLQDSED